MRTAGLNEAAIQKYIQEQEKADIMQEKLNVKLYELPLKKNVKQYIRYLIGRGGSNSRWLEVDCGMAASAEFQ